MPTATMKPAMPASESAKPIWSPRMQIAAYVRTPETIRLLTVTRPSAR